MSMTYKFSTIPPSAGQAPQVDIKCYESVNATGPWVLLETALIADLTEVDGVITWTVATADPDNYHILSPVTAEGTEYPLDVLRIIPPPAVLANTFTAFVNTVDIDGQKREGVKLTAKKLHTLGAVGGLVVIGDEEVETNIDGFASMTVVADISIIVFELDGYKIEFDTTAQAGQSVDLASLIG